MKKAQEKRPPKEGQDPVTGQLLPGHKLSACPKNENQHRRPIRLSGRHWIRRALEIPEEEWPKTTFCAADRNARKLVQELNALKGKDFIASLSTAHQDAYGQEARIEVREVPDVTAASHEIARIEAEIQRLLKGGK